MNGQKDRGDHYVVFKVIVPSTLTSVEAELFSKLSQCEQTIDQEAFAKQNAHKYRNDPKTKAQGETIEDIENELNFSVRNAIGLLYEKFREMRK